LKFGENLPVRETLAQSSSAFQECGPFNRPEVNVIDEPKWLCRSPGHGSERQLKPRSGLFLGIRCLFLSKYYSQI
jgi:hypothetical protein